MQEVWVQFLVREFIPQAKGQLSLCNTTREGPVCHKEDPEQPKWKNKKPKKKPCLFLFLWGRPTLSAYSTGYGWGGMWGPKEGVRGGAR